MTLRWTFRWAAAPLVVLLALLPLGCTNPFMPAEPEPPNGQGPPEDFKTIEGLLATISLAIDAKSQAGSDTYIRAMAESTAVGDRAFRAFYDPGVRAAWLINSGGQIAPEPWNLFLERGLYSELSGIRQNDPYRFEFTHDDGHGFDTENPVGSGLWEVHRHYELKALPSTGVEVTIAIGFADLILFDNGSRFSIIEWHDRVDPDVGVNPSNTDERTFSYYRLESQ